MTTIDEAIAAVNDATKNLASKVADLNAASVNLNNDISAPAPVILPSGGNVGNVSPGESPTPVAETSPAPSPASTDAAPVVVTISAPTVPSTPAATEPSAVVVEAAPLVAPIVPPENVTTVPAPTPATDYTQSAQ